ncbi:hypothetical protein BG006_001420 [Podila minutissima]|uniref:UBC core domain-containing protein n=1 Tax=Podila minutissima TaxID=64525 RepID=A0A9P5VP33_9FUNG|nr:hypothetical protein BG006_001420 [Podila minutissima]
MGLWSRQGNWGPAMSIPTVLLSLRVLLSNPNPDDPLLVDVAAEYKEDRALFQYKAAKYTKQYAVGNDTETNHVMTSAESEREGPRIGELKIEHHGFTPVDTEDARTLNGTIRGYNYSFKTNGESNAFL